MAAKGNVHSHETAVESIVNRWLVDYYLFLALESFKNEQYADFCGIRRVLNSVLSRPLESTDAMATKLRILQFLSRINEGERLDMSFESDQSITPLESALMLLENINQECSIPQQDFESVCTSVKEMIVRVLIKNNEFDKAKEILNKHFPKPMVGKKALFMGLIRKKSKMHEVIELIDFPQFKGEIFAFCQRLFSFSVPFLHKAAKQLIDKRLTEQDDKAAGPDEQDQPGTSSSPQIISISFVPCLSSSKRTIIQKTRLEEVYKALAGSDEITFAKLEEEVEREEQARNEDLSLRLSPTPKKGTNQDRLFQRDSGSPIEASPADQPPQTDAVPPTQAGSLSKTPSVVRKRRLYTVAQLVVEPDSLASSQCSTASQEQETEVSTEEPPQSQAVSNKTDSQSLLTDSEITIPSRKLPRRASKRSCRASTSLAELSTDSEEDPPGSVANREICARKLHKQSVSSLIRKNSTKSKQLSSDSEEDAQKSSASIRTSVQKTHKQQNSDPPSKQVQIQFIMSSVCSFMIQGLTTFDKLYSYRDPGSADDFRIIDSSLDNLPSLSPPHPITQDKGPSHSKWKQLYNNAKETKESWSDEETYFTAKEKRGSRESISSNSGHRKRRWTESETLKLKEGVKKFGEGNWGKIKAYYKFDDRTNVNLKDRWRTMKKLNMV
ncbi:telomeric repeat binding factor a [Trachinotus anak]|uniref:telomeric repeat binding factor a n=1 Tax=Trachinotus anak TaxID=443729 RepID=UPI0039F22234